MTTLKKFTFLLLSLIVTTSVCYSFCSVPDIRRHQDEISARIGSTPVFKFSVPYDGGTPVLFYDWYYRALKVDRVMVLLESYKPKEVVRADKCIYIEVYVYDLNSEGVYRIKAVNAEGESNPEDVVLRVEPN